MESIYHQLPGSKIISYLLISRVRSLAVLLELPVPVVEGADLPGLEPSRDAVEVECVVAHAPGHSALLVACLVRLALDAGVHYVVPADGAVVDMDVPGPERHSIPLLDLEDLLLGLHRAVTCHARIRYLFGARGVYLICVHILNSIVRVVIILNFIIINLQFEKSC